MPVIFPFFNNKKGQSSGHLVVRRTQLKPAWPNGGHSNRLLGAGGGRLSLQLEGSRVPGMQLTLGTGAFVPANWQGSE